MRAGFRISTLSKRQLGAGLAVLSLALALPAALLVRQAYGQLKWESFHHYRGLAEDLTGRIDAAAGTWLADEERRSFADYSFLVVEGDVAGNFVQRSDLSAFPVASDLPGALGYFQVDGDGQFTTPLLPPPGTTPESVGIDPEEYGRRIGLARRIRDVLADNRLVQPAAGELERGRAAAASSAGASAAAVPDDRGPRRQDASGQAAFDALSTRDYAAPSMVPPEAAEAEEPKTRLANSLGKVADLNLQTPFDGEAEVSEAPARPSAADKRARPSRKEQVTLPETVAAADQARPTPFSMQDVRIDTFESELDPMELSLLDSGHFVVFRKVWRNRERFIQGIVVDSGAFLRRAVDEPFRGTAASGMSDLIVAYGEDVIHTGTGRESARYTDTMLESPAPLLYRSRLSSPLDGLELIYRIRNLPPGPGAAVLGWVTLALAAVFCAGFYALYRLGAGQIDLARQQQDFVSAVSHELKTPLTSIRMYGEMLKEGWADPGKKQQYYEFIHDESERLTRLITNVLQLAKITRNRVELDPKPIAVGALMRDLESRIANQVRLGGFALAIECDAEAEAATVAVDADAFTQIMINLVDNAVKFSSKAATRAIELAAHTAGGARIRFSVRDYGPGVPASQMKKIFRLFYRPGDELTRETVGTGIGLAIVHQLALAMGGEVDVVNREPGAEFTLTLPRT